MVRRRSIFTTPRTEQWVYAEENSATPTLVGLSDASLSTDQQWQESDGQVSHSFSRYETTTTTTTDTPPVTVTTRTGNWTTTTIQPDGSKAVATYTAGRATSRANYDANNVLISQQTSFYDTLGRLQTSTDSRDGPTDYTYYADDTLHTVTTPPEAPSVPRRVTSYTYTTQGQQDIVTLPDGRTIDNDYFPTGELQKVRGAGQYAQDYEYTPQGRLWKLTTTSGVTEWQYKAGNEAGAGQLAKKLHADGTHQDYTYTTASRILTKTNARGHTATYAYTTQIGEATHVTYSDTNTPPLAYGYDRLGQIKSGQLGNLTRHRQTNAFGRIQHENYTGGTHSGTHLAFAYDTKNRLQSHVLSNHTGALLANGGLQVSPAQATLAQPVTHSYGYDEAGRLESAESGAFKAKYNYASTAGALVDYVESQWGGQAVLRDQHGYDNLRRSTGKTLQTATGAAILPTGYEYNAASLREKATVGTHKWAYAYDANTDEIKSGIKQLAATNAPLPGQQFSYNYDGIGNRLGMNGQAGAETDFAQANSVNSLTTAVNPSTLSIQGNAPPAATVTLPSHPAAAVNRSPDGFFHTQIPVPASGNQPTQVSGTVQADTSGVFASQPFTVTLPPAAVAFVHDPDGNLTKDGKFIYTWDAENRLTGIESETAGPAVQKIRQRHQYDDLSRLTSTLTELYDQGAWHIASWKAYHYDAGFNRLAETDISGTNPTLPAGRTLAQSYLWGSDLGGGRHTAGGVGGLLAITQHKGPLAATYSVFADGNGNILRITNIVTAQPAADYAYGPFGEPLQATGPMAQINPFRWSSKPTDDFTGLVYYGYRWFNARQGRWLSFDPLGERGGVNLYGMVGNEPVGKTDILGLAAHMNYRPLGIPGLKQTSPLSGHVFLSFDEEGLSEAEKSEWKRYKKQLGIKEGVKGINSFSYHPEAIYIDRRKAEGTLPQDFDNNNRLSVLVTDASYVDVDNRADDIESIGSAKRILVAKSLCGMKKLLQIVVQSTKKNNGNNLYSDVGGPGTDPGTYSFLNNNCGHWAYTMVKRAGLTDGNAGGPNIGDSIVDKAVLTKWNLGTGLKTGVAPLGWTLQHTLQWIYKISDLMSGKNATNPPIPPVRPNKP